jgi:uncharacterized SAM-binding protein YcdF (DUF218 family)
MLVAVAVLPIGDGILASLERRFPPFDGCSASEAAAPGGIVLLGGAISPIVTGGHNEDNLNDAADRIRFAARLAREYPTVPVLVSGGQVFENGAERSEAQAMADLLVELGVSRDRIVLESQSRTTAENAAFIAQHATDKRLFLVTSAFHMPRAVGTFRKAGLDVIAAPADWRVEDGGPLLLFSASENLRKVDIAAREYIGLLAYWLTGRTDELFPGPREGDACL